MRFCTLSALESGTDSNTSCPGVATVPQTQQEPCHGSPGCFHQTSSLPGLMISASYRVSVPKESHPLLPGHPSDVAARSLRTHPHGTAGGDNQVNAKNQLSPWARRWHRGLLSAPAGP